jgi:hypothetical protein
MSGYPTNQAVAHDNGAKDIRRCPENDSYILECAIAAPVITENSVRTHERSDWKTDRGSRPV